MHHFLSNLCHLKPLLHVNVAVYIALYISNDCLSHSHQHFFNLFVANLKSMTDYFIIASALLKSQCISLCCHPFWTSITLVTSSCHCEQIQHISICHHCVIYTNNLSCQHHLYDQLKCKMLSIQSKVTISSQWIKYEPKQMTQY